MNKCRVLKHGVAYVSGVYCIIYLTLPICDVEQIHRDTQIQASTYTHTCTYMYTHTQSSIGNVKTLRSQLHSRRTALNEEIEKENQFVTGSKKLVGATLDHKIRDQASLEMSFAESKVKALQSELSKINSSLNAYQNER